MNHTQRTVVEVLDLETGEIIDANSFFNQEEGVIFQYRRQQQEAAEGFGDAKFKCIYCDQLIRINGKGSGAGKKNFYFSHLSNSEYCDIKLIDGITEAEKQERRYVVRRESKRHKELKHFVYEMLIKNMEYTEGVTETALEQTHFHATLDQFKRPDIFATYKDISIAFEVQLSTIFLDIIIGRDKFYEEHGIFIIWIFNLLNEEQEWQRVMEKDIYYANKRNAFVLNDEAMKISKERNALFFYCYWQQPIIVGDKINIEWHKKLISLAELKYDYENLKIYYHDSDADFEKAQQDLRHLITVENEALIELYKSNKMPHIEFEEGRRVGWKYKERILIPCEYSQLVYLGNGFVKGEKKGLTNIYGKEKWCLLHVIIGLITPCMFDYIGKFENGLAKIAKDIISEYVNRDRINQYFSIHEGISYRGNKYKIGYLGLFGMINEQGEIIIPFEFDEIEQFLNDRAKAKKEGKWGYINEQGEIIIPFEFDEIEQFLNDRVKAKKEGKWGYINEQGEIIIPFEFDEIGQFLNDRAKAKKEGKWGYINEQGEIIIPFEFDKIEQFLNDRVKAKKEGKWGYINEQGEIIIPFEFDIIEQFSNGKAKAQRDSKWGYMNEQGEIIIPFEFDIIEQLPSELFRRIRRHPINEKYSKQYSTVSVFDKGAKAQKNGKWGYISEQGEIVIPFEFDIIEQFSDSKAKVQIEGKWGYISEQGEIVISFEFDIIEQFSDGKAKVQIESKWGYISEQGEIVIPLEFDKIEQFSNGKAKAQREGKWGYISEQGEIIIPFEFDKIEPFSNGIAIVRKKAKWSYIDTTGKELVPFCKKEVLPNFISVFINSFADTGHSSLGLRNNHLTSLPAEIGRLTNLMTLSLGENRLTSLPAEIGRLTNLKLLDLSNNQLTSLPAEIGQLTNLTMLGLRHNKISNSEREKIKHLLPKCRIVF